MQMYLSDRINNFIGSTRLMCKLPVTMMFSYWFTIKLRLLDICLKKHYIHHFFLDIVSPMQIVLMVFDSKFFNLFEISPYINNFATTFWGSVLRKGGNWQFSMINCESGKLSSNFVSSMHKIPIGTGNFTL